MITATARKTSWRPHYAAPTWSAVWEQMRGTMQSRGKNARNLNAPPVTNAEAVAFIRVWRGATTSDGPLWYQLAAHAYGWNPPANDRMRVDAKQAAAEYPMSSALWSWSKGIAAELDARGLAVPASLAPNKATFGEPLFYGEVRAHLMGDGAEATVDTGKPTITPTSAKKNDSAAWLLWVAAAWLLLSPRSRKGKNRS